MNTDNPQQTVSDFEIGWISAMVEAEGSIVLLVSKRANRTQALLVTPRIVFTNTDELIIQRYLSILSRLEIGKYVRHTKPNNVESANRLVNRSYRDITYINVEGFKRVTRFLSVIQGHLAGEKRERAKILLRFVTQRVARAESEGRQSNISYDQSDVETMLEFLRLTNTQNYDKIARMLNDHTREAKRSKRREYKKSYNLEHRDRDNETRRLRRAKSRYDLFSHESARDVDNSAPAI